MRWSCGFGLEEVCCPQEKVPSSHMSKECTGLRQVLQTQPCWHPASSPVTRTSTTFSSCPRAAASLLDLAPAVAECGRQNEWKMDLGSGVSNAKPGQAPYG